MRARLRRSLFAQLAAMSVALGPDNSAAAEKLESFPEEVLSEAIEEAESEGISPEERARVIRWIASDARPFIRAQAAAAAATLWPARPSDTLELLRSLASDRADVVRSAVGTGLSRVLAQAPPVDRIQIVCEWTTSADPAVRVAVARALASPTPVFVGDLAIECLAADPKAEVRTAALLAAAAHFEEAPTHYAAIAQRLATDPERGVRRIARGVLGSMRPRANA